MYLFTTSQLSERPRYSSHWPYIEPIFDFHPPKKKRKKEEKKKKTKAWYPLVFSWPCIRDSDFVGVAASCRTKYVLLDLAISFWSCDLAVLKAL